MMEPCKSAAVGSGTHRDGLEQRTMLDLTRICASTAAKAVIKHTLRQPSLLVGPTSLLDGVLIFYGELLGPWKSEDRSFFSFRTKTVKLGWRRGVNVEEVSPVVQESLPHPSGTRRDNGDKPAGRLKPYSEVRGPCRCHHLVQCRGNPPTSISIPAYDTP